MMRRWSGLLVPLVAGLAVLASGGWLVAQQRVDGWGAGGGDGSAYSGHNGMAGAWPMSDGVMRGAGMRGSGGFGLSTGFGRPVRDLSDARDRAERFAGSLGSGLRVGEVMRFTNHYYAELQGPDGSPATEVLVDPRTGTVRQEPGPAMMWNTRFGMMAAAPRAGEELTAGQARAVAARWLEARGGLDAGAPEAFPGYYTMHTLRNGRIEGMLSVHATTGAVWYHGWHGRFLTMAEGE